MAVFFQYFTEGVQHITDLRGYDHMLFLAALSASYSWENWKKVIWLVTAFTLGHFTTLILAGLDIVRFSSDLVEFLIPCTIAFTAATNLARLRKPDDGLVIYLVVVIFGLIHGMGFSSYFRMISSSNDQLIWSLLAFNFGVEAGQLLIVSAILTLYWGLHRVTGIDKILWKACVSALVLLVSLYLVKENWPS
jgi:hypothetical protein